MADLIQEQAAIYTPGENDLVYYTMVTMGSYSSPQPVVIKQYDSLPIIAAKMRKDGNDYQVPDGAAVNIRLHKRSGTFIYSSVKGISQDRKTAYIQLTSNMTAVYGRTMPCLEIVVNGSVACTGDMVWDIQRNPVQEDDVKDTSEGQYIQEMAAQVQAFEDTYQEALDYMNNTTNQSRINNAASNAQAAQQAATNAANSADEAEEEANRAATESAKALGFRSFHGGQVVPGATDGDLDPSRPMSTPTAASVTIKARGDRIAGLTMAGKTTQAGTGGPSPENIRTISGVGMYDQCIVLDGSEDWKKDVYQQQYSRYTCLITGPIRYGGSIAGMQSSSWIKENYKVQNEVNGNGFNVYPHRPSQEDNTHAWVFIGGGEADSVENLKQKLQSHPLIIWYRSVYYAKSTGPYYTAVELSDDPYRAVGFELNQPLFDGDSLKVGGLSGFDQMVVLDGSSDEQWAAYYGFPGVFNCDLLPKYGLFEGSDKGIKVNRLRYNPNIHRLDKGEFFFQSDRIYDRVLRFVIRVDDTSTNVQAVRDALAERPLIVFYKSVNYNEENDIPVALETHQRAVQVLNGTESIVASATTVGGKRFAVNAGNIPNVPSSTNFVGDILCSHYKPVSRGATDSGTQGISFRSPNQLGFYIVDDRYTGDSDATNFKAYLVAQYSAGAPVQIVYELATPVTYARPVPTMIAQPGEDGTFTVTGENRLSVLLKAFQDGGDAARLNGHTWDDIMAAIDQKITSLASTVMEVN